MTVHGSERVDLVYLPGDGEAPVGEAIPAFQWSLFSDGSHEVRPPAPAQGLDSAPST